MFSKFRHKLSLPGDKLKCSRNVFYYRCQFLDIFVWNAQGGQSDFLRKLSELRVGKEWNVT